MRAVPVLVTLTLLYVLHYDFWLWNRPEVVLGLPLELWYQLTYCLVVSATLALLVHRAWEAMQEPDAPGPTDS